MGNTIKTVLVTGSEGYIGSHVVKVLKEKGYNIIGLDKVGGDRHVYTKFYKFDLCSKHLSTVFDENKIDCVIHLAGVIEAGESMINPEKYYYNNVVGTLELLNVMRIYKCDKIIFSSSAAVYSDTSRIKAETNIPEPVNNYGLSKLMVEQILDSYEKSYGLKYVALRYFNAAGADESGAIGENHNPETHLIPLILDVAIGNKDKIQVYGDDYDTADGSCIRDYIHVNDIANAHILAMEHIEDNNVQLINLGTGTGYSVFEVIKMCEAVTGKKIRKEIVNRRDGDAEKLVAYNHKALALLGWKPKYNLKQIIQTAWKWHKKKNGGK